MLTVNCSAQVTPGVTDLPLLTLTHPNGTIISGAPEKVSSVTFNSVQARDAGQYICSAEVVLSDLDDHLLVVQSKENISLKCKLIKIQVIIRLISFFFFFFSAFSTSS